MWNLQQIRAHISTCVQWAEAGKECIITSSTVLSACHQVMAKQCIAVAACAQGRFNTRQFSWLHQDAVGEPAKKANPMSKTSMAYCRISA